MECTFITVITYFIFSCTFLKSMLMKYVVDHTNSPSANRFEVNPSPKMAMIGRFQKWQTLSNPRLTNCTPIASAGDEVSEITSIKLPIQPLNKITNSHKFRAVSCDMAIVDFFNKMIFTFWRGEAAFFLCLRTASKKASCISFASRFCWVVPSETAAFLNRLLGRHL